MPGRALALALLALLAAASSGCCTVILYDRTLGSFQHVAYEEARADAAPFEVTMAGPDQAWVRWRGPASAPPVRWLAQLGQAPGGVTAPAYFEVERLPAPPTATAEERPGVWLETEAEARAAVYLDRRRLDARGDAIEVLIYAPPAGGWPVRERAHRTLVLGPPSRTVKIAVVGTTPGPGRKALLGGTFAVLVPVAVALDAVLWPLELAVFWHARWS